MAVDLRRSSPTYGKHVAAELAAAGPHLLLPVGFAHGFCALEPETEVFYNLGAVYSAAYERGVSWLDPRRAIAWPIAAILSRRDAALPRLRDLPAYFD